MEAMSKGGVLGRTGIHGGARLLRTPRMSCPEGEGKNEVDMYIPGICIYIICSSLLVYLHIFFLVIPP